MARSLHQPPEQEHVNPLVQRYAGLPLFTWILVAIFILIALFIAKSLLSTVHKGTYVIKQAAVSGELSAHMTPGMFWLNFGSTSEWPVSEMFDFTASDKSKGDPVDDSIEVTFNDGGKCRISGTCRVVLPTDPQLAIDLVAKQGFRDWEHLEDKLLLQTVRRALLLTANLMSSKESYSNRRADFFLFARDQIENGLYLTSDQLVEENDPISGKKANKVVKEIKKDTDGKILRDKNPLDGLGLSLKQFDIKEFNYEAKVMQQISTQQDAIMAVQTAMANAQKSQQDAITAKAQGEAIVVKAEYEEKEKKIRATVKADQEAEVAIIAAQKEVDVAEKGKQTAAIQLDITKLEKESAIEKATGESEARRMILVADGALDKKLAAWVEVAKANADALSRAPVPGVVLGGIGKDGVGRGSEIATFLDVLTAKSAKDLALDMSLNQTATGPVIRSPVVAPKK